MELTNQDIDFAKNYDASKYDRPSVTADTALFRVKPIEKGDNHYTSHRLEVLLIQRKRPPYTGGWGLPGGFCNMDETLAEGAARELYEETGLKGRYYGQIATFDKVDRDPRTRVFTTAYLAIAAHGMDSEPKAGDDAAEAKWFQVDMKVQTQPDNYKVSLHLSHDEIQLEGSIHFNRADNGLWERQAVETSNGLSFDHLEMIAAAVETLRQYLYLTDLPYYFVAPEFLLKDLQGVFEAVIGQSLLRNTFFEHIKSRLARVESDQENGTLQQTYRHRDNFIPPEGSTFVELWRS